MRETDQGRRLHAAGFTLLELIIALLVVAIVAAFALSSYRHAMIKARRAEGKVLLQIAMAAQERHYATFNRYSDDLGSGGLAISAESTPGGYYRLIAPVLADAGQFVTLRVAPQKSQTGDAECGVLTLDSTGRRAADGAGANCW